MNAKEKKKIKFGMMTRLLLMTIPPIVIMASVLNVFAIKTMKQGMRTEALEGLGGVCESVIAAYDEIAPGDYTLKGEQLYKGSYSITENEAFVDSLTSSSDTDVTLFYGDTRRATSLLDV